MVKDTNEKNNLNQGPERPEDSPEMKQYKKERQEAIDAAKKLELELAHKLEKHEFHAEKEKAQDFMRQTDFPEIHPEGNNSPEYRELQEMFAEIQTDHVEYPFFVAFFLILFMFASHLVSVRAFLTMFSVSRSVSENLWFQW